MCFAARNAGARWRLLLMIIVMAMMSFTEVKY